MSQELPTINELEDLANLTQQEADDRHGDRDKRARNKAKRQLARRVLKRAGVTGLIVAVAGPSLNAINGIVNNAENRHDNTTDSYSPTVEAVHNTQAETIERKAALNDN